MRKRIYIKHPKYRETEGYKIYYPGMREDHPLWVEERGLAFSVSDAIRESFKEGKTQGESRLKEFAEWVKWYAGKEGQDFLKQKAEEYV